MTEKNKNKEYEAEFVSEHLGSATRVNLDGKSEKEGDVTAGSEGNRHPSDDFSTLGPPWDLQPSLKEKAEEIGVDVDQLIDGFKQNKSDQEIAQEFGVTAKAINYLRDDFEKFGLHSMQGISGGD
ncbi:hypothetical protein MFMK1_001538 [Metallumcola ferriviriculae]|uniref:Helix-turn-helix domain-containing protein n=1 Tax=Metallumcola ferriviriculae TaxID=3039180 RepID=A0AAU0UNF6_9FIRM|nr:hypothetical protein MFMK1_001538 [Desulfitibacteraceae bacterium MK1]